MYHFKSDFRKRLERLYHCLGVLLLKDSSSGFISTGSLFPFLFSIFSQVYCTDISSFLKKNK